MLIEYVILSLVWLRRVVLSLFLLWFYGEKHKIFKNL